MSSHRPGSWFGAFAAALFWCLLPCTAYPQGGYVVKHFNADNGLPLNGMKNAAFDKRTGLLWAASDGGLIRYDGQNIGVYNHLSRPSFKKQKAVMLVENRNGEIFAVNETWDIFRINGNGFEEQEKDTVPNFDHARDLMLFRTLHVSVWLYKRSKKEKQPFAGFDHRTSYAAINDSCGFAIGPKKAFYFDHTGVSVPIDLGGGVAGTGIFKIDGHVCYLTEDGKCFEASKKGVGGPVAVRRPDFPENIGRHARLFWNEGRDCPLLLSKRRPYRIVMERGRLRCLPLYAGIKEEIPVNDLLFEASSGTLFILTNNDGFYEIRKNALADMGKIPNSHADFKYSTSQLALDDSSLLTGELEVYGRRQYPAAFRLRNTVNHYFFKAPDGSIWYSTDSTTYRYDPKTGSRAPKDTDAPWLVWNYLIASHDTVFLFCTKGIKYFTKNTVGYTACFSKRQTAVFQVFDLALLSPGVVLMGCERGLLKFSLYDPFKMDTLLRTNGIGVRSVVPYGKYFFLGTDGAGIFIYDGHTVKQLPLDVDNNLLNSHCFVNDSLGNCWISSNKGLYRASTQAMIAAFESKEPLPKLYYYHYDKRDGMRNSEMNGRCNPCGLQLKNGTISFPTVQGVQWVYPGQTPCTLPKGEIFIESITSGNRPIGTAPKALYSLPSETDELKIKLCIANWDKPENLYVYYQLDNGDRQRMGKDQRLEIVLSRLGHGPHRLAITKLNGLNPGEEETKELAFSIDYPWYLKWWNIAGMVTLTMALFLGLLRTSTAYYRARNLKLEKKVSEQTQTLHEQNKSLQEKNAILERSNNLHLKLVGIISHDIITPLRYLHESVRMYEEMRPLMPELQHLQTLGTIRETSKTLELLSTDILNWIKLQRSETKIEKQSFLLRNIVEKVLDLFRNIDSNGSVTLENLIPDELLVDQYLEPVHILVYNLLSNSIRFTEKGLIQVSSKTDGESLWLSVYDEGVGMERHQVERILNKELNISTPYKPMKKGHGLGYIIVHDLLGIIGGSLNIESEVGKFTKVTIKMPMD